MIKDPGPSERTNDHIPRATAVVLERLEERFEVVRHAGAAPLTRTEERIKDGHEPGRLNEFTLINHMRLERGQGVKDVMRHRRGDPDGIQGR